MFPYLPLFPFWCLPPAFNWARGPQVQISPEEKPVCAWLEDRQLLGCVAWERVWVCVSYKPQQSSCLQPPHLASDMLAAPPVSVPFQSCTEGIRWPHVSSTVPLLHWFNCFLFLNGISSATHLLHFLYHLGFLSFLFLYFDDVGGGSKDKHLPGFQQTSSSTRYCFSTSKRLKISARHLCRVISMTHQQVSFHARVH